MTHKESGFCLYPSEQPRTAPTQPGVKVSQPCSCPLNSGNKHTTTVGHPGAHHLPGEVKPSLSFLLSGPICPCRRAELCDITDVRWRGSTGSGHKAPSTPHKQVDTKTFREVSDTSALTDITPFPSLPTTFEDTTQILGC